MAKSTSTGKSVFRVALNPRNAEANSWYDPGTGVNLFLDTPISQDLSHHDPSKFAAIKRGIRAGLLIVAEGELPEGLNAGEINKFAAPRSRWATQEHDQMTDEQKAAARELAELQQQALSNWDALAN